MTNKVVIITNGVGQPVSVWTNMNEYFEIIFATDEFVSQEDETLLDDCIPVYEDVV